MDGKTTKSSVSSGEMEVQNVSDKTIKDLEKMNGYVGVTVAGIEMGVTERNVVEINDSANSSSSSTDSGKKTSKYIIVGNSIIMKFREKIQDIINGVTLKVKGDKDKEKDEEKASSKKTTKTSSQKTEKKRDDNEK